MSGRDLKTSSNSRGLAMSLQYFTKMWPLTISNKVRSETAISFPLLVVWLNIPTELKIFLWPRRQTSRESTASGFATMEYLGRLWLMTNSHARMETLLSQRPMDLSSGYLSLRRPTLNSMARTRGLKPALQRNRSEIWQERPMRV